MINKLISNIRKTNAPIVVGLDPMLNYIPEHIQKKAFAEFGETLEGAAEAIWQYNKGIVDATCDLIPAVKPQIAMYEQFGIPGLIAYKKTVEYCKAKDLVVIGDIKRGDIGSTSAAYAVGHLGQVQVGSKKYAGFDEDFATVNPYLGSDGVKPFMDVCKEEKKGIFVLVKTSNPSSGEFQDQRHLVSQSFVDPWIAYYDDFPVGQTADDILLFGQPGELYFGFQNLVLFRGHSEGYHLVPPAALLVEYSFHLHPSFRSMSSFCAISCCFEGKRWAYL